MSLLAGEPGLEPHLMAAAHELLQHFFSGCKVCNWNSGRASDGFYLYAPCPEALRLKRNAQLRPPAPFSDGPPTEGR